MYSLSLPRSLRRFLTAFLTMTAAMVMFAASAFAATDITLTFIRHGESEGNASGLIDTSVPGPELTELGKEQAAAIAEKLTQPGSPHYDAIYASDMIRTQQTAKPLADILGEEIQILPGLHEINAGLFEGSSENDGIGRIFYALAPMTWALGARFVPILGSTDANGNVFEDRVNGAIQDIYDSGAQNPAIFSHGATMMFWTMMNVDNPDLDLLLNHRLSNTSVVVVEGNPEDGWTLKSWDGVEVSATPSLATKLFVDFRTMIVTPQSAAFAVGQALQSGDLAGAAKAFVNGTVATVLAPVKFAVSATGDIVRAVGDAISGLGGKSAVTPEVAAAIAPAVDNTPAAASTEARIESADDNGAPAAKQGKRSLHRVIREGRTATAAAPAATESDTATGDSATTAAADGTVASTSGDGNIGTRHPRNRDDAAAPAKSSHAKGGHAKRAHKASH